jgi:two-component system response regulator MprA
MKEGRVLVVDDEPMVRETLGQVLLDEGYAVDLASDGEAALRRVEATRPDAILLDLLMPGMNGRQFLAALRARADFTDIPVLIMTAVHGLEVNLASLGATELVEKPFNVDDLLNKVALAVYRSRDAGAPSQPLPFVTLPPESAAERERGVVLIVERERERLQQLDLLLSQHGYTVVSMTRALVELSRLVRALQPRAILVDIYADGTEDVLAEVRAGNMHDLPVLAFARGAVEASSWSSVLANASDADLLAFVERLVLPSGR